MSDMYKRKDVSEETVELTITLPRDAFDKSYEALLKDQAKEKDVKGFRKGKVPGDLIEPSMKPMLQFETFERIAPMYINTAIQKEEINLIAPPKYKELPDFKKDGDLQFTVEVTRMPDFKLGNLKKVKVEQEDITIDDKEVDTVLKELKVEHETDAKKIGDSWAKELSEKLKLEDIESLDDLKKMTKDALKKQKEHMLLHKAQEDALNQAIELSNIEIPEAAVEFEADERERSFNQDMQSRGIKVEEFLQQSNLKMEQMREAWEKDGRDALRADVFLNLYADQRDIKVSKKELEEKVDMIKKTQSGKDESIYSNEQWLEYIRKVVKKEKSFREFIKEVLGDNFLDEHN